VLQGEVQLVCSCGIWALGLMTFWNFANIYHDFPFCCQNVTSKFSVN